MKFKFLHLLISLSITGIMLYFVAEELGSRGMGREEIFLTIKGISIPLFLCYLSISIFAVFVRALRYLVLLRKLDPEAENITYNKMLILTAIRNALVDMFPARLGEVSFFYILKRFGINFLTATSVFALCLALDIAVLAILFFLVLLALLLGPGLSVGMEVGWLAVGGALLLAGVLFACLFNSDLILKKIVAITNKLRFPGDLIGKINKFFLRIAEDLSTVKATGSYPSLVFLTICLRIAKYGSLYLLVLSVVRQWGLGSAEIHPLISSVAFVVAETTASLPISGLLGFGAYEGAYGIIMKLGGSDIPAALSLALIVHVLTQVVGYTVGLIGAIGFLLTSSRYKHTTTTDTDGELPFVAGNKRKETQSQ